MDVRVAGPKSNHQDTESQRRLQRRTSTTVNQSDFLDFLSVLVTLWLRPGFQVATAGESGRDSFGRRRGCKLNVTWKTSA